MTNSNSKSTTAKRTIKSTPARKTAAAKKIESQAKQHPVSIANVPEARYLDTYLSRHFTGNQSEFDIFDAAMQNNLNVLIEGPTGPGKTSAALAYGARESLRFYAIPSNIGIEPSQLFGKYIPATSGGFMWQDGPVTDIVRNGGLLLVNEVNFMPERVATVLFGLLDKRREIVLLDHKGEVIRAHQGKGNCWCDEKDCDNKRVLILADMNPEYEGTRPLNKAFRNRFAVQLWWDYDAAIERKLVKSNQLVVMAEAIRAEAASGSFETPVSTNMLQEFEQMYALLGLEFACMNFVNHFAMDERSSVEQILNLHSPNIDDELSEEREVPTRANDDENDDEWGIEGVDWVWEEEDEEEDGI